MDIICPACGKKGRIDDAKIPDSGIFARCPGCKKKLWINKVDGVSLAEKPAAGAPLPGAEPSGTQAPPEAPPPPLPDTALPHQVQSPSGQPTSPPPTPESSVPPVPPPDPAPAAPVRQPQQTTPAASAAGPATGFEVSPLPTADPQPEMGPPPEIPEHSILCSVCSNAFPDSDIVRFGETTVCAGCKPQYVQMMRSGVAREGSFRYGGFWIRFVAKIIDMIIMAIAQGIVVTPLMVFVFKSAMATPDSTNWGSFLTANIFLNLLSVALGATYTTLFIGKYQATPGKMAFGLKVVAPDGGRISYMRALGRHFAEMVSAFTLTIGYIMAGFDSQKRALHDRISSTRVIRT